MITPIQFGDGNKMQQPRLVVGKLHIVLGQRQPLDLADLLRVDAIHLLRVYIGAGRGLGLLLVDPGVRQDRHLTGWCRRDRGFLVRGGGLKTPVDQDDLPGIQLERGERLQRRGGFHRPQPQNHLLVGEIPAGEGHPHPLLIVLNHTVAGENIRIGFRIHIECVLDVIIAVHDLCVLAQLPGRQNSESRIGETDDQQEGNDPAGGDKDTPPGLCGSGGARNACHEC